MSTYGLFRRSRTRLALWYSLVMGGILSLSSLAVYRSIVQANWAAMEREIESIAGTLHDSLEPMLPASGDLAVVLQQIFPDLCLVGKPCIANPTLIQRHTTGISDRTVYYIRLFDHHQNLLGFSPNQPAQLSNTLTAPSWQTIDTPNGPRYRQFTIVLHNAGGHNAGGDNAGGDNAGEDNPGETGNHPSGANPDHNHRHDSWGYLQIGRTLASLDAETQRIQWILAIGFPVALGLVVVSSWWLSGLAMQPIYQSYQQQQQFTANAAHELRSPLASLLATVEAISRVPPSDQQTRSHLLQTVERQGRRLSELITDLLLLSNLEQNNAPSLFEPCCLNDLIGDLGEEFLELAIAAEVHLSSTLPDRLIHVLGNEQQLYRLVSNLIANAIHYTPPQGQIQIRLDHRDRLGIITIQDNGIGISPPDLPHIFDRFYRVNSDRSRKTGGTGLGLAIAQAIALKHQARIKVESQVNQGSIFTIEFQQFSLS